MKKIRLLITFVIFSILLTFLLNFNQEILTRSLDEVKRELDKYMEPILNLNLSERAGWVCGLGHGILKTTPEENVSYFIKTIRENFK